MKLVLCPKCKKPYLSDKEICPNCPPPYTWNQESWANIGCLILSLLPLAAFLLFWFYMFIGFFF